MLEIGYLLVSLVQVIDKIYFQTEFVCTMLIYVYKYMHVGIMATKKLLSKFHEIISRFDKFKQDLNNF